MNNISSEYAEALFLISCEENAEEEYLNDIRLVGQVIDAEPEYIMLLRSPNLTLEEKLTSIDEAFGESVNENVLSFLKLLCENNRMENLGECIEAYEALYNQIKGVVIARVTSAVELTDLEKERLTAGLEKKLGRKVELACAVDPAILGGIIVETGDTVIDGSVKRKIQEVKEVINSEPKAP